MNYEIVELKQKVLVGVSAVTGNADPKMNEIIGGLWQKLYQSGVSTQIKNKTDEFAIGLYSDYANQKYTVTVGNEVSKSENPELTNKIIPAGKYAKFQIHGNMVTAVVEAWGEIWETKLDRKFSGDFEEYLNNDFENADINIYIALN